MIATWIPDTTNGARSFVVFLVIESRMSGGPSPSHVIDASREMPHGRLWVILLILVFAMHGRQVGLPKRAQTVLAGDRSQLVHTSFKDQRK